MAKEMVFVSQLLQPSVVFRALDGTFEECPRAESQQSAQGQVHDLST